MPIPRYSRQKHWIANFAILFSVLGTTGKASDELHDLKYQVKDLQRSINLGLTWDGDIEFMSSMYKKKAYNGRVQQEGTLRSHLKPKVKADTKYELNTDFLFRADAENSSRNTIRIDETYISARLSDTLTLKAGKMIFGWGSAPFYNPTDALNPVDYYDFYHLDKLGVMAIDMGYYSKSNSAFSLRFGVIPVFEPSIIEDSSSRWIDYSRILKDAILAKATVPTNFTADYDVKFSLRKKSADKPQVYVRASTKLLAFDSAFLYTYRYNPLPTDLLVNSNISYDLINNRPNLTIEGVPYYRQEHLFGADLSTEAFSGILFAEGTYSIPIAHSSGIDAQEEIQNLNRLGLGANLTKATLEENSKVSPYMIVTGGYRKIETKWQFAFQFAKLIYLGPKKPGELFQAVLNASAPTLSQTINPRDLYDYLSGAFSFGGTWEFYPKYTAKSGVLYNVSRTGFYITAGLDYAIKENLRLKGSLDYMDGKGGSLTSYYNRNSKVSLGFDIIF